LYITEDFVNTSLVTLVGIEGDDEVTVLDDISSVTIDTKPLDWCVAAFITPDSQGMRTLTGDDGNSLLARLISGGVWVDKNLNSKLVPRGCWGVSNSGRPLPTLGINTTYSQPMSEARVKLESLPSEQGYYYTCKESHLRAGNGYMSPYMYYGVSPFLGMGSRIPCRISQSIFNKICTLLDNPAGIHLIVLGESDKAQSIFGSGFWSLRQFIIDYHGIQPSELSTPLDTPLPFKYSIHAEMPDLSILINRYGSTELLGSKKEVCTFEGKALDSILDIMWSLLYFDYAYLGTDPVRQDCYVASSWRIPGNRTNEEVPFNNPALVLLIGRYNQLTIDSTGGAYLPDDDVTIDVMENSFLKNYKQALCFIEYSSPYSQCLANMRKYSKALAISMYRRTCSKNHVVMPSGRLYPKKTDVRREIAAGHKSFNINRTLTTYIKVFSHLWEKIIWRELSSEVGHTISIFSFLSRSYDLPLSSLLSGPFESKDLDVTISKETLAYIVGADTSSALLDILRINTDYLPEIEFLGKDSMPNTGVAIDNLLSIYASQVVCALRKDRYSVIDKASFDRRNFTDLSDSGFTSFTGGVKVLRAWEENKSGNAGMTLAKMIRLWQHTKRAGLYEVLEVVVSMLTALEVDMPASMSGDVSYRTRVKRRIGVASIKRKLLDVMSQTEAGSKLGQ